MRARLAKAAFEVLAEKGISSLRTAAVVDRIGVSQGALLHHFPNKSELIIAAVEYALAQERDRSLAAATALTRRDKQAVLGAMMADFRAFFFEEPFWGTLDVTMDSVNDKDWQQRITDKVRYYRQPIYERWTTMLAGAGVAEPDAEEIVTMTAALISGLAMRSLWRDVSGLLDLALKRWTDLLGKAWLS